MKNTRIIEIGEATAAALEARAAELGLSVSDLVAELVAGDRGPETTFAAQITELERRWEAVEQAGAPVPSENVVCWLETWGTQAFRPWRSA
jgi:predicted transcriptional regulator